MPPWNNWQGIIDMAGKEIKPKAIECSCFRHSYPSLIYYQLYLQPSGFIPKYLSQFAFLDLSAAEMSCQWYIVDDKCLLVCHTELNGICYDQENIFLYPLKSKNICFYFIKWWFSTIYFCTFVLHKVYNFICLL